MHSLSTPETRAVVGIMLAVLLLSSVPYALGYALTPAGTEFGGFLVDLDDSYSYVAAMQQGRQGGWEYRVLFTPEDHPGAYLHTFYLALGKLSALLGLSLIQVYHLSRLACGLALLASAYLFLSRFLATPERRVVALLLVGFSSGLGWVVLLTGSTTLAGLSPLDFWLIDAYAFFTIFTFPHSAAAVALLLTFLTLALKHSEAPRLRTLGFAGLCLLCLCIIHPFAALLVDGILVAYWILLLLFRRNTPGNEAVAFAVWMLVPLPLIAYYLSAFEGDAVLANWTAQNILPSPLLHLLLGYGILTPLAVAGAIHTLRHWDERMLLLVAWVSAALLLLYVPFTLQRRMVEGLHVPVCILSTVGLVEYLTPVAAKQHWVQRFARWRGYESEGLRRLIAFLVIAATLPSNLYLTIASAASVLGDDPSPYYLREEIDAVDWLKDNTSRSDTLLASYRIGRYVPARTGHRVFLGHFHETVRFGDKLQLTESFFGETGDEARQRLLAEYGIAYVFHGPSEKRMGAFDPSEVPYLTKVYTNERVTIYGVNP